MLLHIVRSERVLQVASGKEELAPPEGGHPKRIVACHNQDRVQLGVCLFCQGQKLPPLRFGLGILAARHKVDRQCARNGGIGGLSKLLCQTLGAGVDVAHCL